MCNTAFYTTTYSTPIIEERIVMAVKCYKIAEVYDTNVQIQSYPG